MNILNNNRFIHLKNVLPRIVEAITVNKMKDKIINEASMYQIGGVPGHEIEEHVFTIKSIMAMREEMGTGIIFTLVDIIAFFDKEDIYDCMDALEKIGVNKKAARVWFKLNQNTKICVNTAVGVTDTVSIGDCVGQGSTGAGLISQANIGLGLQKHFGETVEVAQYGDIRIQPLAWQDDLGVPNENVSMARNNNKRMEEMLMEKLLEAHPDKSVYIVTGSSSFKKKVREELKNSPLVFGTFNMKEKESEKYLGQVIHSGGLEKSSLATVQERIGRIKGATLEIKSIIEEFTMQSLGSLVSAWILWEKALVPCLLSGSGAWLGDCTKAADLCDEIQLYFWRKVLAVPISTPKIAIQAEMNAMSFKWRIWLQKCLLLRRIKMKDETALAKKVYLESIKYGWPGLARDVKNICLKIGIPDLNYHDNTKVNIKKAIRANYFSCLKTEISKGGKLSDITFNNNISKFQDYMHFTSLNNARLAFRIKSQMVDKIPCNFKKKYSKRNNPTNRDEGLYCPHCENGELYTQKHVLSCLRWIELRKDLNMNSIKDLVTFFKRLLKEKEKLEPEK